ncbi:MAG: hypothetical protein J3K34DRAFT_365184 [Monoraphidium minutum]|nr:MAG: hypothetical protein J3K34DRAFT_365184 [Monoraphidium minutum]
MRPPAPQHAWRAPRPRPCSPPPPRLLAVLALLALAAAAAAAPCAPPYDARGPFDLRVAPGEARALPSALEIPAGQRALVEGELTVAGGITVRGTLFLSSNVSSKVAAHWVAVAAGGALVAGSEACPLPPGVTATLELRDGPAHPGAGRKALAGVLLERSVAFEIAGHAFFMEDGAEWGNTLRGNLGMLVRPKTTGARLGSDAAGANGDLSVFWLTNPDNTLESNPPPPAPAVLPVPRRSLVGYSDNTGDPGGDARFQTWDARLGRSTPRVQDQSGVTTGLKLYDGPTVVRGLAARGFPAGTAPLAVRSYNSFQMAALSSIQGFKPEGSVYRFLDSGGDGGKTSSIRDVDGSVSGYAGATLLPRQPGTTLGFYSTPGCTSHPAFGLACPHKYINLEMGFWDWVSGAAPAALSLTRANLSPDAGAGAAGLAAQRLALQGGGLITKPGRGGRYYNAIAAGCTNNNDNSCAWTRPFTSARVRTKLSAIGNWRYGRIEVRAQLPRGDFLWPAIWMLPTDNVFGKWAASGEIDIVEARGQARLADTIEGTLHYGASWPDNVWQGSGRRRFAGVDFSAGMHDFAVEWTSDLATGRPKLMRWLVDGVAFYERNLAASFRTGAASPYTADGQPWDQRFHLILNGAQGAAAPLGRRLMA